MGQECFRDSQESRGLEGREREKRSDSLLQALIRTETFPLVEGGAIAGL